MNETMEVTYLESQVRLDHSVPYKCPVKPYAWARRYEIRDKDNAVLFELVPIKKGIHIDRWMMYMVKFLSVLMNGTHWVEQPTSEENEYKLEGFGMEESNKVETTNHDNQHLNLEPSEILMKQQMFNQNDDESKNQASIDPLNSQLKQQTFTEKDFVENENGEEEDKTISFDQLKNQIREGSFKDEKDVAKLGGDKRLKEVLQKRKHGGQNVKEKD